MKHARPVHLRPPAAFSKGLTALFSASLLPVALLTVLSTAAVAQPAVPVDQFTLANGLTVIVKPDQRARLPHIDVASDNHSRIAGHVPLAIKLAQVVRRHRVEVAHPADDGAAVR